jgi:hypothetical protein
LLPGKYFQAARSTYPLLIENILMSVQETLGTELLVSVVWLQLKSLDPVRNLEIQLKIN